MRRRIYFSVGILTLLLAVILTTSFFRSSRASEKKAIAQLPVEIKVVPYGPTQEQVDAASSAATRDAQVQKYLSGNVNRLISFGMVEADNKGQASLPPTRFVATFYDYTNNRVITAEGKFDGAIVDKVTESFYQPLPNEEEYELALKTLREDQRFSAALRAGTLATYHPMPPVIEDTSKTHGDRIITIGLRGDAGSEIQNEIVGVNLSRGGVVRYAGNAPPASKADGAECGTPLDANQSTVSNMAGQHQLIITQGPTELWRMLVIRPANRSSGTRASGIELRNVMYRGKSVLKRGHAPILNVKYGQNECGPYRDWQYQEGQFMTPAGSTDLAPGIRSCPSPATTALENGTDMGNFTGVAIYTQNNETVLVTELEAGWYRYIMEWRLGNDGTIRPRFGFGAVRDSCICSTHHHHVYWRFDFDVVGTGNRVYISERGKKFLMPQTTEFTMLRNYGNNRRLVIQNGSGSEGYIMNPNPTDGNADTFGVGDMWVLRYKGDVGTTPLQQELDDGFNQTTSANAFIQIGSFVNGESINNQDVVVWYGAHFIHNGEPPSFNPSREGSIDVLSGNHVVGPDLRPIQW
ncbi:MAG: hypothetical protein H7Y30_11430 [Pyrinomonadaceae bacterium]|nr:hypothetical protein [Pyrinomonadaceae bacterium]